MITLLAALVLGMPSPDVPSPTGPEPNPACVYVIPIATPGVSMCPDGSEPPQTD